MGRSHRRIQFGSFELDEAAGELRNGGEKIKLQEQPLLILQILLKQPGAIVTREEVRKRIWPADTFVDFDHGINNAIKRLREALGDTAETPRFIETLPRRGYRFIGKIEHQRHHIRSLAVLPLANLSNDPEQEFFSEGLTEALITALAKIGELRVISRTSSMLYKCVRKPLREIARELDVEAVVQGTVFRAEGRVRITAQLIDGSQESHLWAESYERDMRDVLALQSELAQAIATGIQIRLTPQEKAQFADVYPVEPSAYEAYLKGRFYWNRRSQEGFQKAVQHFREAIAKDPSFAAAHAGLADCLALLSLYGFLAPDEGLDKAKELAQRAIDLDPALAEGHVSLAMVKTWYDFEFRIAEKSFERAIELNPRHPIAHSWFGYYLGLLGRYEEAYTESVRAIRLDPLSGPRHWVLAIVNWLGRRFDEAIDNCQKTLEFDPNYVWAFAVMGWANMGQAMYDPAVRALEQALRLSPDSTFCLAMVAEAYAAAGRQADAHKILERLKQTSDTQYVGPYQIVRLYTALGEKDNALHWLETSLRERASHLAFLKCDCQLDSLRSEPRFQEVLRRMNFPE